MSWTVHLVFVFDVFIAVAVTVMVCGRRGIGPTEWLAWAMSSEWINKRIKSLYQPITRSLSRFRVRKCWSVGSSRVIADCWSMRSIACLRFLSTCTRCQKLSLSGYAVSFSSVWIPLPTSNRNWMMLPTDDTERKYAHLTLSNYRIMLYQYNLLNNCETILQ